MFGATGVLILTVTEALTLQLTEVVKAISSKAKSFPEELVFELNS